jgi:hypothetical protein
MMGLKGYSSGTELLIFFLSHSPLTVDAFSFSIVTHQQVDPREPETTRRINQTIPPTIDVGDQAAVIISG